MRGWITLALSLALTLEMTKVAAGDAAQADRYASEADELAKAGDFRGAAAKFREAWKADPRPNLFCNIGISYYKAKELAYAHLLLNRCIERTVLDAKLNEGVRNVIAAIDVALRAGGHTPVTITAEPSPTSFALVEHGPDEAFVGTRVVWFPFGTHRLQAHAEGYVDQEVVVDAKTAEPVTVKVVLVPKKTVTPPPPPKVTPVARRSKVPAYITTGITVLAIAGMAVSYVEAHARADIAGKALDAASFEADKAAVQNWNTGLAISGGVAVVGAALSSYLWIRSTSSPQTRRSVELTVGAGGFGIGLSGTY